jgi:dTDP-4-dehydrorhamnose reductase
VCAPLALARACAARGTRLVTFSSDLVFDGAAGRPYVEGDAPAPLGVYGEAKAAAERGVLAAHPGALVVRTGPWFGPHADDDVLTTALGTLARGRAFGALADVVVTPAYLPALADAVLDLLIDGERGLWHLAHGGPLSWHELARRAAEAAEVSAAGLRAVSLAEAGLAAPRPRYSALGSERGTVLGTVENAICHYVAARRRLAGAAAWTGRARPRRRPQSA